MNQAMWSHPSTVSNVATLKGRGAVLLGPDSGEQACGDVGFGRMREPSDLVADLSEQIQATPELVGFSLDKHWFCGDKTLLITAGPTHEAWDPVRFLSNQSSGRMGFALAKAAQGLFARVILIAGPVELPTPTGVTRIDVVSAADMAQAVLEQIDAVDIFIAAAAVADFRPIAVLNQKIKKTGGSMFLELEPTEDIAQGIAARSNRPFVVGFAAETDEVIAHAKAKRARKKFDAIVANEVGKDRGFGDCEPTVHLINARSEVTLTAVSKEQLAPKLLACILDQWIQ
jgi:phosphopantothenoylcysteine decarboxylase/phosphopantothenate--cysteine ligase